MSAGATADTATQPQQERPAQGCQPRKIIIDTFETLIYTELIK